MFAFELKVFGFGEKNNDKNISFGCAVPFKNKT